MKKISNWWRKYRVIELEKVFELQTRTVFSFWSVLESVSSLEIAKERAIEHKNNPNLLTFIQDIVSSIIRDIKESIEKKKKRKIHNL